MQIRGLLAPGGVLIASVPNFGHWYARTRTALGMFDYDQRGVLDNGTYGSSRDGVCFAGSGIAGFSVVRQEATGLPLDVLAGGQRTLEAAPAHH